MRLVENLVWIPVSKRKRAVALDVANFSTQTPLGLSLSLWQMFISTCGKTARWGPIHQLAKAHVPVPSWALPRPTPWTSSPPNPRPHSFPSFLCFPWQVHGEWDPAPGHVDPGIPKIQCSTPAQRPRQTTGPSQSWYTQAGASEAREM